MTPFSPRDPKISSGVPNARLAETETMRRLRVRAELSAELGRGASRPELLQLAVAGLPRLLPEIVRVSVYEVADDGASLQLSAGAGDGPDLLRALDIRGAADLVRPVRRRAGTETGPLAAAPLIDGPTVLGVVAVERARDATAFSAAELEVLAGIAARLAGELHRVQVLSLCQESLWTHLQDATVTGAPPLPPPPVEVAPPARGQRLADGSGRYRRSRSAEIKRVELDLRMARDIQRRFLPTLPRETSGLHIAAEYRPAFELGGDFYDLVRTGPGTYLAVIGDVSGKGVAAALIMSRVMAEFRVHAHDGLAPNAVLAELNAALVHQGHDDAFVTAACVAIDTNRRWLTVANAGHVPLIVRRSAAEVAVFGEATGAPLGMIPGESYGDQRFKFAEGDIILMMTDGITEALDPQANPLNTSDLVRIVAECDHDIDELSRRILAEVEIAHGALRADDVALMALRLG